MSLLPESIGSGLVLKPSACPVEISTCAWVDIQGNDGKWYNASTQRIVGNSFQVGVKLPDNVKPIGVRYLYNEWPVATVFNKEGLPATPFYINN